MLGGVVNVPLNGSSDVDEEPPSATVNHISLYKLEEMLTNQYNKKFNERNFEERQMSREGIKFLNDVENSAVLQEGSIV